MNVSPYFTIEDGWEEDEELKMTLYHDANDHEISFNLEELYEQKREEDVKVKDQYNSNIKASVTAFVERENALGLDTNRRTYDEDDYEDDLDEDYDDEYDEEDEDLEDDYDDFEDEDYDDFDEEDEYDDEDEEEDEDLENEEIEHLASEQSRIRMGSVIDKVMGSTKNNSLKFEVLNGNEAVLIATLPKDFVGGVQDIIKAHDKQILDLFEEDMFVIKPNKKDVLVLDAEVFSKEDAETILVELYEQGGDSKLSCLEKENNREYPLG
jgi:hypothetical protein